MKKQFNMIIRTIFLVFVSLIVAKDGFAQLSGTKTIPGDYATIAAAVTAVNGAGVGAGGVTFDIAAGHTETTTTPITLTATGTVADPVVFQKSGAGANPKVTRTDAGSSATSTLGGLGDMVISISTGDYITFDGIDVEASNQGVEYGYYLTKTATDACKFVTIKNAAITMTKGTSAFVTGIYVSNAPTAVSSATGVTVSNITGRSENITITGNTISNVFCGIYMRGWSTATYYDLNITVGAIGAGNTIQNFAGNSASTSYGVYSIYQNALNVGYNTINNTAGGGANATSSLYGVFASTGAGSTANLSNNNVTLTTVSSLLYGINNAFTGNLVMDNNTVSLNSSGSSTAVFGFLYNTGGTSAGTNSISGNTFATSSFNTTGTTYLIYNSITTPATQEIQNNVTSGTITRTGASGAFHGYYSFASPTGTDNVHDNNFSNINVSSGSGAITIINVFTTSAHTENIYNNTISNITSGTGTLTAIVASAANTKAVYNNQIFSLSGGGTIIGISNGSGATSSDVYKNKIYDLTSSSTATSTINGIVVTTIPNNINIHNNLIGNLTMPAGNNTTESIRGINITGTTALGNINLSQITH